MTEDLLPEAAKDRFAPEKVSPVVAWLCTDAAADVTGRIFCASGNRISMLNWQVDTLAEQEQDAPLTVEGAGEIMESTRDRWPKPLNPMDV
jgi:NAD(P)-dependent dehydrogenase (short-subunit alcohol dehydrogenase family)